jgi:hypothetical protein
MRFQPVQLGFAFLTVFAVTFFILDPDVLTQAVRIPVFAAAAALLAAIATKAAADYLGARIRPLSLTGTEVELESPAPDFGNLEVEDLKSQLDELKRLVTNIGTNGSREISEQMRASLAEGAVDDLVAELKRKLSSDDHVRRMRVSITSAFGGAAQRLSNEVEMLRDRANLNMLVGCFIALFGAGVLTLVLFLSDAKFANLTDLVLHMVPRFSIVVLIELFAYFFLSMYRANLTEIRYYQNEITTIDLRRAGTLVAILSPASEAVFKDLIGTDRNGVLKSDQTTQELERLRIESASMKHALETVGSFFTRKK